MKTGYILGSLLAFACIIVSCQTPEIKVKSVERTASSALYEGSSDSLFIDIDLEWPLRGLTPKPLRTMQEELISSIFGQDYTTENIEEALDTYISIQENDYHETAYDLWGFTQEDSLGGGLGTWGESIEGRFLKPHKNMQSYLIYAYEYTGGAHGLDGERGLTFNLSNGKRINEADLFISGYEEKLAEILTEQLPRNVSKEIYNILFIRNLEPNDNFYIGPEGITYIYNRYEIGPYVCGIIKVTIPWEKVKSILK